MNIISILLLVIVVLEVIIIFYYLFNKKINKNIKMVLLSSLIILIILFIKYYLDINIFDNILDKKDLVLLIDALIIVIILKLVSNIYDLSNKYNNTIKSLLEYERIIDEQGKRNHEYKNQLMILKGYINNKNRLEKYLDTIIEDHKISHSFKIRQLANFKDGGLKRMIYYKISEMKENNIKYYLYVSSDVSNIIEELSIDLYKDITKVIGVLLDNAIEAALDSKEKEVGLDFSIDGTYIIITIYNSYNRDIDIKKIGKKGYTSKGKGHGFGLRLVKDIIKRNKQIELSTDYNDNHFIQTALIDTKK